MRAALGVRLLGGRGAGGGALVAPPRADLCVFRPRVCPSAACRGSGGVRARSNDESTVTQRRLVLTEWSNTLLVWYP